MLKNWLSILFIICSVVTYGQSSSIAEMEKELNALSLDIVNNESDESKAKANLAFKSLLLNAIEQEGSFEYAFKGIQAISILTANETVKIYNWALPKKDETFEYFAILHIKTAKDKFKIVELNDGSEIVKTPETRTLTSKNWFGALYYHIIYDKKMGKDTYTLLGWDGDYNLTNKKIMEVMTVSSNGSVRFGSPIIKLGRKAQKRVIFTYAETSVMSLKYDENNKRIVFDYLVPTSSNLTGVFEYYGPSLNRFDAFVMDHGKWIYQADVNVQLNRNLKDNLWVNPKEEH